MIKNVTHIYFLGIGGIGMSALARYFHDRGVQVCGYDKQPSALTGQLQQEGISITHIDDPATINVNPHLVVYTPAVPKSTALYRHFTTHDIPVYKRSEVLGLLSAELPTIAIAGTHGKTTITAMLTHIMKTAGIPCLAFLGGISTNYNTNFVGDTRPEWMIAEADEFDRSFLKLSPKIALISSMDADHLDIYGSRDTLLDSFRMFARRLTVDGTLIINKKLTKTTRWHNKQLYYHLSEEADYYLENIAIKEGRYHADICGRLYAANLQMQHPGYHNLENALAAAALAHQAGVAEPDIIKALNSFTGVRRRFEICFQSAGTIYVDDYAHHPEEIKATIQSAREMWPGKKITGVFQPHLYSRTKDLADEFARSLQALDELILLDIYPAREEPIPGIDAGMLLQKISMKTATYCKKEDLLPAIQASSPEVLITMGAGDIDRFAAPIRELLEKR